jgi:hypothetical protein
MDGAFAPKVNRRLAPVPCPGLSGCRLGYRRRLSLARCFDGWLLMEPPRTIEGEFRIELRMVRFQGSRNERRIFRRVPAEAPTNHARRMAPAVEDEPFTAFFTPRLKESSLFHAASNARRANQTITNLLPRSNHCIIIQHMETCWPNRHGPMAWIFEDECSRSLSFPGRLTECWAPKQVRPASLAVAPRLPKRPPAPRPAALPARRSAQHWAGRRCHARPAPRHT